MATNEMGDGWQQLGRFYALAGSLVPYLDKAVGVAPGSRRSRCRMDGLRDLVVGPRRSFSSISFRLSFRFFSRCRCPAAYIRSCAGGFFLSSSSSYYHVSDVTRRRGSGMT